MLRTRRRSRASGQTSATILSNGTGVEREVAAQLIELQRLVVDDRAARLERQHVLVRGLRVHRDEEVDLLLARDVAVPVGADGVPGRQPGDVGREEVLAGDRHAHLEDRPQQDEVGGLAARAVDRRHLDAEIVDAGVRRDGCRRGQQVGGSHGDLPRVGHGARPRDQRGGCPTGQS